MVEAFSLPIAKRERLEILLRDFAQRVVYFPRQKFPLLRSRGNENKPDIFAFSSVSLKIDYIIFKKGQAYFYDAYKSFILRIPQIR